MMSDYLFGTGMNEAMKWQTVHNKTFFYVFNYFSWNDYLPYYRGISQVEIEKARILNPKFQ